MILWFVVGRKHAISAPKSLQRYKSTKLERAVRQRKISRKNYVSKKLVSLKHKGYGYKRTKVKWRCK